MNTILLVIVGAFLAVFALSIIAPILGFLSMILMISGLAQGDGVLAFSGLVGMGLFGSIHLWFSAKNVYVVNKR